MLYFSEVDEHLGDASREDGRPALVMTLRWRRRLVDMAEKSTVCNSR